MKGLFLAVLAAALLFIAPSVYGAPPEPGAPLEPVGTVRVLDGEVVILRGGKTLKATPNLNIFEGDVVDTGAHGKVGLTMRDDTTVSMGRKSRLLINKFKYYPKEKNLSFLVRVLQGTAFFVLGKISKLAPDNTRIETPQAAIGVRGSHVLVKVD